MLLLGEFTGEKQNLMQRDSFYVMAFLFLNAPVVRAINKRHVIIFLIVGSNNEVILFCETGKYGLNL